MVIGMECPMRFDGETRLPESYRHEKTTTIVKAASRRIKQPRATRVRQFVDLIDLYDNDHGKFWRQGSQRSESPSNRQWQLRNAALETPPELLEKTDALDPDLVEIAKSLSN